MPPCWSPTARRSAATGRISSGPTATASARACAVPSTTRAASLTARPGPGALAEAEAIVTAAHGEAVERLIAENPGLQPDLVGFHGQTVFHAPARRLTVQIGDGPALARRLGMPVVYDFRAADVAAGGRGRALRAGLSPGARRARPGGRRRTWSSSISAASPTSRGSAADGSLTAGDTGPGNALIDDFVRARTGARHGQGRSAGGARGRSIATYWSGCSPIRGSPGRSRNRSTATPSRSPRSRTFRPRTARRRWPPSPPTASPWASRLLGGADIIIVAGGGAHNPTLLRMLARGHAALR